MAIKPSDLNQNFIKKIENKYGKIHPEDFFSDDLKTYYKTSKINKETGGITHDIISLPSFTSLFKSLETAREEASDLSRNKEIALDPDYKEQAQKIKDTFNGFRTWFRKNYPDQYEIAAGKIQEIVKEISTSGATPGYNTPYAFGKANTSQYTSIGYKPVNRKSLRKKSKGIDYVDLYK